MSIRKFRASRVNNTTANVYLGQPGDMFYDPTTGQLKISDGTTPGGHYINLVVATPTQVGGIKAGPGANVSADGTLTIDTAGLPLSIGDLYITGANISTVNANENLNLVSNGTGQVNIVGNLHVHTTAQGADYPTPILEANDSGNVLVNGNLITNGQLVVNGASFFYGNVTEIGNLLVSGNTVNNGNTVFNGNVTQVGNLTITGTTVNNGLSVFNGNIAMVGNAVIAGNTTVTGTATLTGNSYITGNAYVTGTTSVTGNLISQGGSTTILAPNIATNTAGALNIVGSNDGSYMPVTGAGGMIHITGNPDTSARITVDGWTTSATDPQPATAIGAGLITLRASRGTPTSPLPIKSGDHLGTIAAVGKVGNAPGYSQGQTGLLFYAAEDYTSNVSVGSFANLQVVPVGSNVAVNSVQFFSNGIVTGNVVAGNVNVGANGKITTPTVIYNDGGLRTITGGTPTINLNFGTDSIIHVYQPTGTVTFQYGTLQAGATITCWINLATAEIINLGVSASNNSTIKGKTNIGGGGGAPGAVNNQAVQLVYTCIDGTAANTYVSATYT